MLSPPYLFSISVLKQKFRQSHYENFSSPKHFLKQHSHIISPIVARKEKESTIAAAYPNHIPRSDDKGLVK
jgi:hypothetical protein